VTIRAIVFPSGTLRVSRASPSVVQASANTAAVATPDRVIETTRQLYPNFKVIVLNDDFNTFEHVQGCLLKHIPGMSRDRAWELTNQVHFDGLAIVWTGPQEQAELYHQQLRQEGLTMAPLEAA
jgi:ATP-dependent Clp protease adaptor protein ClpS